VRLATRSPAPLFGCDAATSTHKSRRGGDLCTYRRCYWGHDSEAGPPRRAAGAVAGPPQRTPGRAPACQCCSLARGVAGRGLQVAASEVPPAAIMMAPPAIASAASSCGGRAPARGAGPPGARGAGRAVGRPRLGAGGSRGRRRQLPPRWQFRVRGSCQRLGLPDGPCGLDGRPPRSSAGSHWRFASDGPGGTARQVSSVHGVRSGRCRCHSARGCASAEQGQRPPPSGFTLPLATAARAAFRPPQRNSRIGRSFKSPVPVSVPVSHLRNVGRCRGRLTCQRSAGQPEVRRPTQS
jgi:hypothetical protein